MEKSTVEIFGLDLKIKKNYFRQGILLLGVLFGAVSCASLARIYKSEERASDPWHGTFLHFSSKYELVLDHFSPDSVSVDIFEVSRSNSARPMVSCFAEIKKDKAVSQDLREKDCRFEFSKSIDGIVFSNFCHGFGEGEGLYKRISSEGKGMR